MVKVLGIDPSLSNLGLVSARIDLDAYDVKTDKGWLVSPELLDKKTAKFMRKSADDLRVIR